MTEQAISKSSKRELKDYLSSDSIKRQLAAAMPRTMSPDRFIRIALQATYRNPALLKTSPESFFNCLIQLGSMGLEPDGRRAHLIPYGEQCTLIVDYNGIKELLRRNHDVTAMHCDVVGANDHFEIRFGTRGILDHVPNLKDRGAIYCAYSWVRLPDGSEEFDVMGIDEVKSIRKRSKSADKGPWITDYNEMAKKTVFRRHSKSLPLSPETRDALERETDGDALTEAERFASAQSARAVVADERPRRGRPPKQDPSQQMSQPSLSAPTRSEAQEPATISALDTVTAKLKTDAFHPSELLTVLKAVRMIGAETKTLVEIDESVLSNVLENWDNALDKMTELRVKQPEPNFL